LFEARGLGRRAPVEDGRAIVVTGDRRMSNQDFDSGDEDGDEDLKRRSGRLSEKTAKKLKILTSSGEKASDAKKEPTKKELEEQERKRKLISRADNLRTYVREILKDCASKADWKGLDEEKLNKPEDSVLIGDWDSYRKPAEKAVRTRVQSYGDRFGCHACGVMAANDPYQTWTADHCPPTKLGPAALAYLGLTDVERYLFPQCKVCSNKQSGVVRTLNDVTSSSKPVGYKKEYIANLDKESLKLLKGTREPKVGVNCEPATGDKPSATERAKIQNHGQTIANGGCHTCGTFMPGVIYDADHVVPAGLIESGMKDVYQALGIELPPLRFRPHCKRCSNRQGPDVNKVVKEAQELASELGLARYWFG
jgi:hypothetical protein